MAESAAEKKARIAAEKEAANNTNTSLASNLAPYTIAVVDEDSGEEIIKPEFKYMEGVPREYKADAKDGNFFIQQKNVGQTLRLQPIASRFFEEDLFNLGTRKWAELFWLDEKNVLCSILFHGFSAEALAEVASPLYYDDLKLSDVVLVVEWDKITNTKIKPAATYHVAKFSYEEADADRTKYIKGWAKTKRIYRKATLKDTTINQTVENYFNPYEDEAALLSE